MNPWFDEQDVHILVVDDEPQNLRILTELLSDTWVVHTFSDGISLLRYLDKGKPADLIMLDVVMPAPDGYEVCRQIRSRPELRDVPVVFLTSLESVCDEANGLSLGAVDFILKPFSPLVVLARLRNHVKLGLATRYMQQQNELLEAKVRERTQMLTTIVEASPVGIVTVDHVGDVLICNPVAESIFGRPAVELLGSPVQAVLPENPTVITGLQGLASGKVILGTEQKWGRPDKTTVTVRGSAAPIFDGNRQYQGAVIVLEDVSELKRVEDQLSHAQKIEAIGRLTSGAAHDFNNLLTVIIGNLDLMDKVLPEDSPAREYMANALRSSLCGADLTRHLLAFSRQQPLQPELVDVNRLLRGTTKLLNRTLGEAIEINVVEDNVNWLALVDPSQLEAAILNLAVNARDAMPDGGTLTLSISWRSLPAGFTDDGVKFVAGDYVVVEVIDTGTGMTPEVKSHAFEPFYTTKPVNKGSGLGLAMVYGFLKQSGGHVVISSEVGHGTSVRLYLPRATESCLNAHSPQLPAVVRLDKSGGETILVVEDNEPIRKLMQHQLKDIGYKVLVAENALMALEIMVANPKLDLLLTDIVMPGGMTGIDLARIFKDRWPEVKIVLCTGSIDESQLRESSALGLITLNKPYRPADLNRKLRLALDN